MGVVGFNQPQGRPGGGGLVTDAAGPQHKRRLKEEPVEKQTKPEPPGFDRSKTEKALTGMLPKISDKRLRLLTLLAHEFIKKS